MSDVLLSSLSLIPVSFSSPRRFICPPPSVAPPVPVCGKFHQRAPGADVQVSGGDQLPHPGETGPGAEGGPEGGGPGPRPSDGVTLLRPEHAWL